MRKRTGPRQPGILGTSDPVRRTRHERRLLRALYAITLVVLVLLLWATFSTFERYNVANQSVRRTNAVLRALENMVSGLKDAQIGMQGYALTHDTVFLQPFRTSQPLVERSMAELDSLRQIGSLSVDLVPVEEMSRQLLRRTQEQFLSERYSAIGLQGPEKEQLLRAQEIMERIRTEHQDLTTALRADRNRYLTTERSLRPGTPLMLVLFAVLAMVATGLLFWRLFRALSQAEKAEMEILRKMDDLNKEVRVREFAERSLKRVLDTSPSAIMAFRSVRDSLGRITDFNCILANRETDRMYAKEGETMVGRSLAGSFPWEEAMNEELINVVENGKALERDLTSQAGAWLRVHAVRLLDGFVITLTDISESRRAQALLAESDRLSLTGGIARTIAHEVRNPLTNLHMALEQMLDDMDPGVQEEMKPYTDILQRNMHRISKLITDLLESSRPKELEKRLCNVQDLLNAAVASVQDRLDLLEMTAEVDVEEGVKPVMADPSVLGVALTNLCINAVEAMEEGKGHLALKAAMHHGKVRICVADNGKGIPESNIQHLFQAFYSGRTGGMGLGLTSARIILNSHSVHMDVESKVGEGTVFILTFPD